MPDQATIKTYGTTANLGPLFDKGGAKLAAYSMVTDAHKDPEPGLIIASDGQYPVPTDDTNLAHLVVPQMFKDFNLRGGLHLRISNDIRPGGLGTSGAGATAYAQLINHLYGLGLSTQEIIKYASLGEPNQHLDNVIPCIVGGITLATGYDSDNNPTYQRLNTPSFPFAVVVPTTITKEGGTAKAREALNIEIPGEDRDYLEQLGRLMRDGLVDDDFFRVGAAVSNYSDFKYSVTALRSEKGVYVIDFEDLDSSLAHEFGGHVVVTPSGAGPAMLLIALDPDVAKAAVAHTIKFYENLGHQATGSITPIQETSSLEDLMAA